MTCRPLTFLITGFGWLLLSSLVGLAVLIGLVHGTPLPSWLRLVHVHAILIGGILQLMIGATHRLLPIVLNAELYSLKLARFVMVALPAGFAILIGGFITSSLHLELAIGGLLILSIGLYAYNLLRTWIGSGHQGNAASDHLMIATFFLVLMMILGLLVGANFLPEPLALPFGSLHLAAYTHMALIGFILQTVFGVLSYGIPEILAADRTTSRKKQETYREQLAAIMDRWRAVQLTGLSFGTMGFGVLAAMNWNFPLSSFSIQIATWATVGLLLVSLTIFAAKLAWALGASPSGIVASLPNKLLKESTSAIDPAA